MKVFKQVFLYVIIFLGVLVVLASLLSLIHDLSFWYSKVLDFPRQQYLIIALVCLMVFVWLNKRWGYASMILCLGLLSAVIIQSTRVLPYLIGERAVPDGDPSMVSQENTVGIMIANVLISNREAGGFLEVVTETDPDLLLAMEVDQWWLSELEPLKSKYPYVMEYPTDNAYGMALYSKFPLKEQEIRFFKHPQVPSFHVQVVLPSGKVFRFHGMHPVAPVPSDRYPDNVGKDEVALLKVGKLVAGETIPSVVAGDLNDVSWSNTSRLFSDEGDLKNVRLGRGIYNSFNARSYIQRWPLDHFFVSEEFSLLELERLPEFGSDHFPLYVKLALQ